MARETQVSLRKSVYLEIKSAIADMGVGHLFIENKTDLTFTSLVSVGSIQMVGCDSEDRIKSIKPINQSSFTKLWFEEADSVPKAMMVQLNLRMRGKSIGDFKKQTYYVFNPTFLEHYLFQDFIIPLGFDVINDWYYEDDENVVMRNTYKCNRFLAEDEIKYLEDLKDVSEYHHKVYLLAEPGVLGDRCYDNVERVKEVPKGLVWYAGMDFGWNDDTAFVLMKMDEKNKTIYIVDGFSAPKLDHIKISNKIKALFKKYSINRGQPIFGDSEDPRIIKQIKGEGLNIRDAKKPKGSVLNGIMILNTYTFKCLWEKGYSSLTNYVWKADPKTSLATNEPLHNYASHISDAARYGMEIPISGFANITGRHINY